MKPLVFERHMQTGIQVLLVALIIWAGTELVKLGQQSVVLEERLTTQGLMLNELRQELREWGDTYYRTTDARRELDEIEGRIDNLNSRVSALETRQ
ncbi:MULTISPECIES: hypothetical protein [unclassified Halomonas]|uniref:hypothetical protein n=1 Tax=unclassified Halomonas TaxID=2609666 RepID=UPI001CF4A3EB|nr:MULTISPECIES: hypothetical protein [unclassified Halomonas]MCA8865300.1 hypothetical protein [Halomonas sp. SBBP1]UZH12263.1 hypothetical protein OM794_11240 [Halomonas sp. BDJS001]